MGSLHEKGPGLKFVKRRGLAELTSCCSTNYSATCLVCDWQFSWLFKIRNTVKSHTYASYEVKTLPNTVNARNSDVLRSVACSWDLAVHHYAELWTESCGRLIQGGSHHFRTSFPSLRSTAPGVYLGSYSVLISHTRIGTNGLFSRNSERKENKTLFVTGRCVAICCIHGYKTKIVIMRRLAGLSLRGSLTSKFGDSFLACRKFMIVAGAGELKGSL